MTKVFKRGYKIFWKIFMLPSVNRRYVRRSAAFEKFFSTDPKKTFMFVTAFNEPELIALHHQAAQKNLGNGCEYFIIDNSTKDDLSFAIREYCLSHSTNYVRLPKNPGLLDGSLHQGLALNWVYQNIVLRFRPWAFGSMDSDLFPMRPVDISRYLKINDAWGIVNSYHPLFYFWAGLSFFRLERFAKKAPNFLPAWGMHIGNSIVSFDMGGVVRLNPGGVDTTGRRFWTFDTGGRIRVEANIIDKVPEIHYVFEDSSYDKIDGLDLHGYGDFVHFQGSFVEPEESLTKKKRWLAAKLSLTFPA